MNTYLQWHMKKYPWMNEQDQLKLLFQSFFGVGHLIDINNDSLQRMIDEASTKGPTDEDLYEYVSSFYVRVHLRTYARYNLSFESLNNSFIQSAEVNSPHRDSFQELIKELKLPPFAGIPSHSIQYKEIYHPSYRVLHKQFLTDELRFLQAYNFISRHKKPCIISLEGKCASGKSTLAEKLKKQMPITILSVDNFFLPETRKSKTRLEEVGGNIDYELIRQVLESIVHGKTITYSIFDCKTQTYADQSTFLHDVVILEGVYSYHPYFRDLIAAVMYLEVDEKAQDYRLQKRHNYSRFVSEWIALENTYFESEKIQLLANLII